MNWSRKAEEVLSTVPLPVRKQIRERAEEVAARSGAEEVRPEHVQLSLRTFPESEGTGDEIKGYQVEICSGPSGCPNRAVACSDLLQEVEDRLSRRGLKAFLRERVKGPLRAHHEFRISISDCPNACSRPQIADLGLIGASRPVVSTEACSVCESCMEVCRESAISLADDAPRVDYSRCLSCGQCVATCPTGTLQEASRGYRILVGGRLGRHPQLGRELPGIYSPEDVLNMVDRCLNHYQRNCLGGERFGEILNRTGLKDLIGDREDET